MPVNDRTVRIILEAEVKKAQQSLKAVEGSLKELGASLGTADSQAKKLDQTLAQMGQRLQNVGSSLSLYVTAPLTALATASVALATQFETTMSRIVGLVDVPKETVAGFANEVSGLGATVGKTANELGEALFFITSAGFKGAEAIDILKASAKASAAGLGETRIVADAVTSAVNAFGIENLSAARATDILVAAVREGKAEATEIAGALGAVIPLAAETGVTFDQVAAAVAAMTRSGLNAAESVTALRGILGSMLSPAKQAEEALQGMGTSSAAFREEIREKGLFSALQSLTDLTRQYGEEAVSVVIPNIRALTGVLNLMGKNAEANQKIFENLANATGSTDKAFEAFAETARFKFNVALAQMEDAAIRLGDILKPFVVQVITPLAININELAKAFSSLDPSLQTAIIGMGAVAAAIGPVLFSFGLLLKSAPIWSAAIGGVGAAIAALSGPIGIAILAIGGLVTAGIAVAKHWEELRRVAEDIWNAIAGFFQSIASTIEGALRRIGIAAANETENLRTFLAEVNRLDEQRKQKAREAAADTPLQIIPPGFTEESIQALTDETFAFNNLTKAVEKTGEAKGKTKEATDKLTTGTEKATKAQNEHEKALEDARKKNEQLGQSILDLISKTQDQIDRYGKTEVELIKIDSAQLRLAVSAAGLGSGWENLIDVAERLRIKLHDIQLPSLFEQREDIFGISAAQVTFEPEVQKFFDAIANKAKTTAEVMAEFWGNTFAEMGRVVGDFVFTAFKGFDDMKGFLKSTLDSMLRLVSDFIGAIVQQKVVIPIFGQIAGVLGAQGIPGVPISAPGGGSGLFSGLTGLGGTLGLGSSGLFGATGSFTALGALFTGNTAVGLGATLLGALPAIGIIAGVAAVAIPLISKLFQKAPEVHIDIGNFDRDLRDRLAFVSDFVNLSNNVDSELAKDLVQIRKGKIGVENKELRRIIFDKLNIFIGGLQDLLNKLPIDIAESLNEALLSTQLIDFDETTKRIIGIDFRGKDAKKRLEQFLQSGELEAQFLFAITPFFDTLFEELGVLPDAIQRLMDEFGDKLGRVPTGVKGSEARVALGQEFLAQAQAFIDAFAFISQAGKSDIELATEAVEKLARTMGFEFIPTVDEVREHLRLLLEAGQIDPTVVQEHIALADAIEQLGNVAGSAELPVNSLANSIIEMARGIVSVINQIQSVSRSISALGGLGIDVTGSLNEIINVYKDVISNAELTAAQQEQLLGEMAGLVDNLVSEQLAAEQRLLDERFRREQAHAQATFEAEQRRIEAHNALIKGQIEQIQDQLAQIKIAERALQDQIKRTQELISLNQKKAKAEIDNLNTLIRTAQAFQRIAENLNRDIQSLILSTAAPLTPFEQLAFLQSEIARQKTALQRASTPEQQQFALEELRRLELALFEVGQRAFGTESPAFQALFKQVVAELEGLKSIASKEGDKTDALQNTLENVERGLEIQTRQFEASIDRFRSQQEALGNQQTALQARQSDLQGQILQNSRLSTQLQQQQAQLSASQRDQALAYYRFIQERLTVILQQKLDDLRNADHQGLLTDEQYYKQDIAIAQHQTILLQGINRNLSFLRLLNPYGSQGFQHGGVIDEFGLGIFPRSGKTFTVGESGKELIIPFSKLKNQANLNIGIKLEDATPKPGTLSYQILQAIKEWFLRGEGRAVIQSVAKSGL
jgi:TP901 family phage tail tape measure protein